MFPFHQRYAHVLCAGRSVVVPLRGEHGSGNYGGRETDNFCAFSPRRQQSPGVNAQALERAGAAVVLEETKLDDVWLVETVSALLGDPARLRGMSEAARSLAHPHAARDIAAIAAGLAGVEEPLSS